MTNPLRVLVVDDSALMRRLLRQMLESDPTIRVVGEAGDGKTAIALTAELRPDLITLDVRMPVLDGVETTRQIMAYHPTPILVLSAAVSGKDANIAFEALAAGALEVMEKPSLTDADSLDHLRRTLIRRIKLLARVKVVTHLRGRRHPPSEVRTTLIDTPHHVRGPRIAPGQFPVVVIGASTGGPKVIRQLLAGLPNTFAAAVIVVQHIAQGFGEGMAEWLAETSTLPVELARNGLALQPGRVLLAPDQSDLLIKSDGTVRLSMSPLLLQRPSIDITMTAVAELYGVHSAGVLLTGMGRDGAVGMRAIRRVGGLTIAQDEASCTIFGMPRAAIELGAAELVLPPDQILMILRERFSAPKRVL
ncbi:MAG: chemotaxis response regulator protein-glutamate methylesterase [Chloroflexus aggregans]|uniref:Protein-glutamate methylesterase/protein-glutamine glutaminase n=1 Tax=Chloroflexus aggregans TaxID=152260 RepID=A0A2J6X4M2_9CHLR|nr:MAG: chemotaxis response regulator protein-glutamate methylesterase [Chloroflexus aggregans]